MTTSDLIASGREAMARNDWAEAFELLARADADGGLDPKALEDLAVSAWWTGQPDECIAVRERAFGGYAGTDTTKAGVVALALAEDHFHKGALAMGKGWLKRASDLLGTDGDTIESAWLMRTEAVIAFEVDNDIEGGLELATAAYERAVALGDRDLQATSLHDQGRIIVAGGDVERGMEVMDEAMVAAVGGELGPLATGRIYCNMIDICEQLADYRRAGDWSDAAKRWCERAGHSSGFPGVCRIHRAEIMKLRGDWVTAEEEATRASKELGNFVDFAGEALYEVGEIRLNMGDYDSAEDAFRQAHGLGRNPQPGLAQLQSLLGNHDGAWSLISRSLDGTTSPLKRARLLPTQVDIALARGDVEAARQAARELTAVADDYGSSALQSHASHARGAVLLAEGDGDGAIELLQLATNMRLKDDLPYLAAGSRMLLAEAYRGRGDHDLAELEFSAARRAFIDLGAAADARRAEAALESAAHPLSGARRAAALMFTDIVDSTALIGVIGDEAWEQLLRWHHRTLRSLFSDHDGREVENTGDGFFVAFDDGAGAVRCAMGIQSTLAAQRREQGFAPEVRIGLHTGVVTEIATTLAGEEVHKAARICAHAGAGEILATSEMVGDLPPGARASKPRSIQLKGFTEPAEVVSIEVG
ncbi:MAG: adenylate/guanylate cyclase domain-containing protein [Acidimicrobiia bacterium]